MKKEYFEWIHSWCDKTTETDLPRVLLVGDSITHAYQGLVREGLSGVCYVDYIATSYAIDSKIYNVIIGDFIKDSNYEVVHFNHGLHGIHMSRRTYKSKMKKLLSKIPSKKVILTATTNVTANNNKKPHREWTKRVNERNEVLLELVKENGYFYDDLHAISTKIPVEYRCGDGFHYTEDGSKILAESVIASIKNSLKK